VIIFQSQNQFFEPIFVGKGDDNSFQEIFFIASAIDTCLIVSGISVADRADFWVRQELFFAGFTQIIT